LKQQEEDQFRQDYNAKMLLLVEKYDLKRHDSLDSKNKKMMEKAFYLRRLAFMRSFDKNLDGYLDPQEAAAMHRELARRRQAFRDHFDSF
jgi:hypothetical protein